MILRWWLRCAMLFPRDSYICSLSHHCLNTCMEQLTMTTFVWTAVTIEAVQKAARAKDAERTRLAALATTTGGRSGHRLHLLAKPIDPSQIVSIPVSCTSRTHRITGAAWKVSPNSYHSWTTDTTGVANNVLGCLSWTCILCTSHGPYGSGFCRTDRGSLSSTSYLAAHVSPNQWTSFKVVYAALLLSGYCSDCGQPSRERVRPRLSQRNDEQSAFRWLCG